MSTSIGLAQEEQVEFDVIIIEILVEPALGVQYANVRPNYDEDDWSSHNYR